MAGGDGPMFDDEFDNENACEAEPVVSGHEQEEIALIKRMMALPDSRPDPGIYRNADSDGASRDVVELDIMLSMCDPRPLTTPWRAYLTEEDLAEGAEEAQ